jgi:hypothetical protein
MYTELKKVERFARMNESKTSSAHPKWDLWAEAWIANGNDYLVTSIDNYHHARKIIKSCGKKCTFAQAGGNCVTIYYE